MFACQKKTAFFKSKNQLMSKKVKFCDPFVLTIFNTSVHKIWGSYKNGSLIFGGNVCLENEIFDQASFFGKDFRKKCCDPT